MDASDFPSRSIRICLDRGWFIPATTPLRTGRSLVRDSALELAQEVFSMLTEWAQILTCTVPDARSRGRSSGVDDSEFTGRELRTGLETATNLKPCSASSTSRAARAVCRAYTVHVAEVTVDLTSTRSLRYPAQAESVRSLTQLTG